MQGLSSQEIIPPTLSDYLSIFSETLSCPQFGHLTSWISGILHNHAHASKIVRNGYSAKHPSSVTRFMTSSPWDEIAINEQRIAFAIEVGTQDYCKYYTLAIDDTVTKKYGKDLAGVGKYWSNSEKKSSGDKQSFPAILFSINDSISLYMLICISKRTLSLKVNSNQRLI